MSRAAKEKKREERAMKGKVFAEIQVLENPRKTVLSRNSVEPEFNFAVFRQTQARLMTAPTVLQAALRDPQIAQNGLLKDQAKPLEWLEQNLIVDFPATEFIRISLKSKRRQEAAEIVNAVVSAYLVEVHDLEYGLQQKRRRELEKAVEDLTSKRKSKMARYRRLAEELSRSAENPLELHAALEFRELARQELAREELARAKDQVELAVLKASAAGPRESSRAAEEQSSAEVARLETSISDRAIRIDEWRRILNSHEPATRTNALASFELTSIEKELEDDLAFERPIRDELRRLDLEPDLQSRISLFRKATAEDAP